MRLHAVVHDEDSRLNVHNVILIGCEVEPVVEKGKLCVRGSHQVGAGGEKPSDDGPAGDNVGGEELVRRVNDANDEADEIVP
jgi:hypothetical protein